MNFLTLLTVLSLTVVWLLFHFRRSNSSHRRRAKLPPGPYPFPIIGNILQLGKNPHQTFAKLSKIYGPLMTLKLGSQNVVIVSSAEMAKEILQKHDQVFSGRIVPAAAEAQNHHNYSIAFLPANKEWRKYRKICKEQMFSAHQLDAGQGLRRAKQEQLCGYLKECCVSGRAVNIEQAAFTTALNLISTTLFSVDFANYDSSSTHEYKEVIQGVMDTLGALNVADFFPVLKAIDPQGIKRRSEVCFAKLFAIFDDIINKRLESRQDGCPKKDDLLEALLDLRQGNEYHLSFHDIKHLLFELFVGGAYTTTSTVEWAMTELLINPEKMSNLKNELKSVIGQQQVEELDISRLTYLQAVIKEIFRYRPPGPLLLPHKAETDIEINGYIIPQNTQVFINIWGMGRDSSIWKNPESFEPERFMDSKIEFRGKDFELIPFGSGRRMCPGMPLANRMIHLMVATLIHNFEWKLEPGMTMEKLDLNEKFGLALSRVVPLKAVPFLP